MDLPKKNKRLVNLKLQVDLPDVQPESTHSTESKKFSRDLFNFDEVNDQDQSLQLKYKDKIVADVAQLKCGRKRQEDRFVAIPDLGEKALFFYAIYDGHGGATVSTILEKNLHKILIEDANFKDDIQKAIKSSFGRMNETILSIQEEQHLDGGSTALCVLCHQTSLYIINVGDSTCVLVHQDYSLEKMNLEHKLNRQDEFKRIEGLATILDRHSVPRINGELAVTRAFGDQKHRQSGLIAEPEITIHNITDKDRYILIASDGFWDIIKSEELQKLLQQWSGKSVEQLAQYLVDQASSRTTHFKKDNMTLIIIDLQQYNF